MNYIKLEIITEAVHIESMCDLLTVFTEQLEIHDPRDIDSVMNGCQWDYIDDSLTTGTSGSVCAYFPDDESGKDELSAALQRVESYSIQGAAIETVVTAVKEEDWANNWKAYFKPTPIGKRIVIKPAWEEYDASPEQLIFVVEPGMVFGTGSHESTQLAVVALENAVKTGDKVLDIGTGSGILAIIALLLGASSADATDIDRNANNVARHNAELNGIAENRLNVAIGDIITDKALRNSLNTPYDIVVSNIVADVILRLIPFIPSLVKSGGYYMVSGIIKERLAEVLSALSAAGFSTQQVFEQGDWRAISTVYSN